MTRKTPQGNEPLANVKTALGRCVHLRNERDAALKTAAASLAQLEAMVDSDTATDAEVNAAEAEYEKKVDALVELDKTLSAACAGAVAESHVAVLTLIEAKNMAKA
jgi:soluble cytochrome b562